MEAEEEQVSRSKCCCKNREEGQTARTSPGTMASKEEQAVKNLNMENAQLENEGGDRAPAQNGEEPRHLGGEGSPEAWRNCQGWVKGLVLNFPWAISNKHVDHDEVGNDAEKIVVQRMETRRKTRGQQMRHTMLFQTPESGNHYDFCLIP